MATLYRKYRPQKLSEVVGQDEITSTLLKQLESGNISHAYVFSGPRGTGKTSTARIIAKALNCLKTSGIRHQASENLKFGEPCGECEACRAIAQGSYLDLIEIDAASNRGIDEIRDLREKIRLSPTQGRYKVYIIDEVHMLTNEAFNALLKTLEEPPAHAVFILATTEPQKLPATILSRAQRFNFQRPTVAKINQRLVQIVKLEKWGLSKEALEEISRAADGAFRDAEVLLEKVAAVNPEADESEVRKIIGREGFQTDLLSYLIKGETKKALEWLNHSVENGANIRLLMETALESLRNILLIKQGVSREIIEVREEFFPELEGYGRTLSQEKILKWVNLFTQALVSLRNASIPQLPLEIAIIEACGYEKSEEPELKVEKPFEEIKKATVEDNPEDSAEKVAVKEEVREEVVAEPIVASPKSTNGQVNLKKVIASWEKILNELKPKNNSLEIFLRRAIPKEIDEDVLIIEFSYRFHKDRFDEPKNRDLLESILEKVLGRGVKIKGVVSSTKPERAIKEEVKEETDPVEVFGKLE